MLLALAALVHSFELPGMFRALGGQAFATYQPGIAASAVSSGGTLALFSATVSIPQITVIDLTSATAPAAIYSTAALDGITDYAATSATNWVIGSGPGVLLQGAVSPARYFGYGASISIAGSTSNAAIATASGQILLFNAATGALQGTITQPAGEIALSGDGTVLAVQGWVAEEGIGGFYERDLVVVGDSEPRLLSRYGHGPASG